MKVNLKEYLQTRSNIVEWAIIHLMTKREKNISLPEWKHSYAGGTMDIANLDVTLTIEGVEVDFIEAITEIQRQNSVMIAEKAKELINEKCSGLFDKVQQLEGVFDDMIRKEKEKLFGPETE